MIPDVRDMSFSMTLIGRCSNGVGSASVTDAGSRHFWGILSRQAYHFEATLDSQLVEFMMKTSVIACCGRLWGSLQPLCVRRWLESSAVTTRASKNRGAFPSISLELSKMGCPMTNTQGIMSAW